MNRHIDRDRFLADWRELKDPERAVDTAIAAFEAVKDEDAGYDIADLELLAEAAWDGPGGDPDLVARSLDRAEVLYRRQEPQAGAAQRIELRYRPWLLKSRAEFRAGNAEQASVNCFAILRSLEELAGGREAMLDIMTRRENPVAASAVRALGLLPASLRRSDFSAKRSKLLEGIGLTYVRAYLRSDPPALYDRTHALASQWFYFLVHDPDADEELLRRLFDLDRRTRPQDARGLLTLDSIAMEFERRLGSSDAAERHRESALAQLSSSPLVRHLQVVTEHGYLS